MTSHRTTPTTLATTPAAFLDAALVTMTEDHRHALDRAERSGRRWLAGVLALVALSAGLAVFGLDARDRAVESDHERAAVLATIGPVVERAMSAEAELVRAQQREREALARADEAELVLARIAAPIVARVIWWVSAR